MKKQILFLLGMLTLIVINLTAQPQRRGQEGERQENRKERMIARLELTEAQQSDIEALRVAHHKETLPLKNALGEKRAALRTLTTSETQNQKNIDRTINEIGTLETQLLKSRTNHKMAVRALLDDKQQMIFDQMKNNHHNKMQKGLKGK